MVPFEKATERDDWVKALNLEPELVEFLMHEDDIRDDNHAPARTTPAIYAKQTLANMDEFYARALNEFEGEDSIEELLGRMHDPAFPSDLEAVRSCFEGTSDIGLIIEDTIRYPQNPYQTTPRRLLYAADWLSRVLPDAKGFEGNLSGFVAQNKKPRVLWMLLGLKEINRRFLGLHEVYEEKGFKALSLMVSSLSTKSQVTFDYHVDEARQRKANSENILGKNLSLITLNLDTMP